MNIHFDTEALTSREARGLAALLANLFPSTSAAPVQSTTAAQPAPSTSQATGIDAVIAQDTEDQAMQYDPKAYSEAEPTPATTESTPATTEQPAPRRRRTKAEMAADEAKRASSADPTQGSGVPAVAASGTTQPAIATPNTASAKPVTAEELRALLNGYISRHSMEEAIAKLREFGCNRVTEALALEPEKLNQLVAVLNG